MQSRESKPNAIFLFGLLEELLLLTSEQLATKPEGYRNGCLWLHPPTLRLPVCFGVRANCDREAALRPLALSLPLPSISVSRQTPLPGADAAEAAVFSAV